MMSRQDEHDAMIEEVAFLGSYIINKGGEIVEGSCLPEQLEFLYDLVKADPGTVMETGFNAGLSAVAFIMANSGYPVISFDTMDWPCSALAKDYITKKFPYTHFLVQGDSKLTLPTPPHPPVSVALVDGGHDFLTAYSDLSRLGRYSRKVVIDDTSDPNVMKAVDQCIYEGIIKSPSFHNATYITRREWILAEGCLGN